MSRIIRLEKAIRSPRGIREQFTKFPGQREPLLSDSSRIMLKVFQRALLIKFQEPDDGLFFRLVSHVSGPGVDFKTDKTCSN